MEDFSEYYSIREFLLWICVCFSLRVYSFSLLWFIRWRMMCESANLLLRDTVIMLLVFGTGVPAPWLYIYMTLEICV